MRRSSLGMTLLLALALALCAAVQATSFEQLTENHQLHGWTVTSLYLNAQDKPMGARFVADNTGFVLDLMTIQSVPQAFFWIKTPPATDRGEPHTCEHLLLGKGNVGRYVASLEDMSLGTSTAYTAQTHTCYHFNTKGGSDIFFELFEAKLNAFCNPDFTDEEIRREVCHVGVTEDPKTGELALEEKGTVYTEMVSAFEKHWYHLWGPLDEMIYGPDHPLANNSGGAPDAIRAMVPSNLREFHDSTHVLGNIGVIVSLADDVDVDTALVRFAAILDRVQDTPQSPEQIGITGYTVPPPAPSAPEGTIKIGGFPSDNPEDPGHMLFAWPASRDLDLQNEFLLELFLSTFASGQTSNLYNMFINSQTQQLDLGGNEVFGWLNTDRGYPVYIGLSGINNGNVNETMVDSVRGMILGELKKIASYAPGSEELAEFNKRASAQLTSNRKYYEQNLNSPPMFGFRSGPAGQWMSLLATLEKVDDFKKSLVMKNQFEAVEKLLEGDANFWSNYIAAWGLIKETPFAMAVKPDAGMLQRESERKSVRIAGYIEDYQQQYGVEDPQAALAAYKAEFDAKTTELEALVNEDAMPGFMDNPPLSLDPNLRYDVVSLKGDIPMVASTFENMTSGTVGIALRLDVIPANQLFYVPMLPDVLTEIGVTKDGEAVPFDDMTNRLRNEIYSLNAYLDYSSQTERVELVLKGTGSDQDELLTALSWMDAALYSPLLDRDNLSRIRDVVDQKLISLRNRMKRSEEAWVNQPANGWLYQENPLLLTANNFLTQIHHMHRLKFRFTDSGLELDQQATAEFLSFLETFAADKSREALTQALTDVEAYDGTPENTVGPIAQALAKTEGFDTAKENCLEVVRALRASLPEIPDGSLQEDWVYLVRQIRADLWFNPEYALAEIKTALDLIRRPDNARLFMISNSADREAAMASIETLLGKLDGSAKSERQQYARDKHVLNRLQQHAKTDGTPTYVGLKHENTRNGVLIFSARNAQPYDTSEAAVLDCLAGKLYSGGGGHSLFMKTWSAGLAYSNGIRYNEATGSVNYYAERCPDVSETMRFVVNELKQAETDAGLTDYTIAQVFGSSRAASKYESRGEEMAADLADGRTPELISNFRSRILQVRHSELLAEKLFERMPGVYGKVLIGLGEELTPQEGSSFFLIGPEQQFESLEQLIETEETAKSVYRLYPRDYWLTN